MKVRLTTSVKPDACSLARLGMIYLMEGTVTLYVFFLPIWWLVCLFGRWITEINTSKSLLLVAISLWIRHAYFPSLESFKNHSTKSRLKMSEMDVSELSIRASVPWYVAGGSRAMYVCFCCPGDLLAAFIVWKRVLLVNVSIQFRTPCKPSPRWKPLDWLFKGIPLFF